MFNRLYDILRANLSAVRDGVRGSTHAGTRQEDTTQTENFSHSHHHAGNQQRNSSKDDQPPPGQDARIAQFYANLELPYGADIEAVKKARKRLLRQYHPDRFHGADADSRVAQELTQEINRAHDELVKWLKNR